MVQQAIISTERGFESLPYHYAQRRRNSAVPARGLHVRVTLVNNVKLQNTAEKAAGRAKIPCWRATVLCRRAIRKTLRFRCSEYNATLLIFLTQSDQISTHGRLAGALTAGKTAPLRSHIRSFLNERQKKETYGSETNQPA